MATFYYLKCLVVENNMEMGKYGIYVGKKIGEEMLSEGFQMLDLQTNKISY